MHGVLSGTEAGGEKRRAGHKTDGPLTQILEAVCTAEFWRDWVAKYCSSVWCHARFHRRTHVSPKADTYRCSNVCNQENSSAKLLTDLSCAKNPSGIWSSRTQCGCDTTHGLSDSLYAANTGRVRCMKHHSFWLLALHQLKINDIPFKAVTAAPREG